MNIKLKLSTSSINLDNQHFLRKSPQGWLTLAICLQYSHMTESLFCTIAKLEINTSFLSVEEEVGKFLPLPLFLFSFSLGFNMHVYVCAYLHIHSHVYVYMCICVCVCIIVYIVYVCTHMHYEWEAIFLFYGSVYRSTNQSVHPS